MAIENDGRSTWSRSPVYSFNKGINRYNEYNDPTYLGFVFMFDYINSPLFKPGIGGARDYLKRTGETLRATYLEEFIKTLESININMPWYWQSFEGSENLWKYNGFKDPYKGGDDSILTISCLESIDLKITMLIDLYRKAVYDQINKRIIVPENLRKFEMYINVQEIRKFQIEKYIESTNGINSPNADVSSSTGQTKDSELYKNENTPSILWLLKYCEFDPDTSSVPFAGLSNAISGGEGQAKQSIGIKYELVEEPGNFYPSFGSTVSSTAPNVESNNENANDDRSSLEKKYQSAKKQVIGKSKSMSEDYEKRIVSAGDRYKENVFSEARNLAQGKIARIALGNVYGATNNLVATLEQGSVLSLGPEIIKNTKGVRQNLGNVHG